MPDYPLNPTQAGLISSKILRYTSGYHFAFAFYFNHAFNLELMKKAIEIEYERNDCLSLRFHKVGKEWRQYFLPSPISPNSTVLNLDNRGDAKSVLQHIARKPIPFDGDQQAEFVVFNLPEHRSGLMLHISHLIADAAGALLTVQDLLLVYLSLLNHESLPKRMYAFKECLADDLERFNNPDLVQRHREFYSEQFDRLGEPHFSHLLGSDFFKQSSKGQQYYNIGLANLIFTKAETVKYHVSQGTYMRWLEFCDLHKCSIESLLLTGVRIYLSRVNNGLLDITLGNSCNRRMTVKSKNTGGCWAVANMLRTVAQESSSFNDILNMIIQESRSVYRRSEFNNFAWVSMAQEKFHVPQSAAYMSVSVSIVLDLLPRLPVDWVYEMDTFYDGTWLDGNYQVMFSKNVLGGGLDCTVTFKTTAKSRERILQFFKGVVESIDRGVNDPSITLRSFLRN